MTATSFADDARMPDRPLRASEAILRCGEQAHRDVVCYVSPFTDFVLPAREQVSFATILRDVSAGAVDPQWTPLNIHERVAANLNFAAKQALVPLRQMTLATTDGILVLRNEMRFLDGLCSSPAGLPTKCDNRMLAGGLPRFDDISDHVRKLAVSRWRTSLFASNYLHYCNPLSFRPFALAFAKSPRLRKGLATVTEDHSFGVALSALEQPVQDALIKGMLDVMDLSDATEGNIEPLATEHLTGLEEAGIKIERKGDRYVFSLRRADVPFWISWMANVDCS